MPTSNKPPRWADRLLEGFVDEPLLEDVQGDLQEVFNKRVVQVGPARARREYGWAVLHYLMTPFFYKSFRSTGKSGNYPNPKNADMLRNYVKIAFRNLIKNKVYSVINIGGLAIGMTVAMLIGLWIYDELSFNQYHKNYDQIAQVWSGGTKPETSAIDGSIAMPYPVATVLRNQYPQYFKQVLMAWWIQAYTLTVGGEKFNKTGEFIDEGGPDMLSLKMIKGTYQSLNNPHSIILSKSTAEALFGKIDPLHKPLTINSVNNRMEVEVTGIYEDIPANSHFSQVQFFAPWSLWVLANDWIKGTENDWSSRPFNVYIQLQPNTSVETVNAAINQLYQKHVPADFFKTMAKANPFVQLIPMSTWHLYAEFENGKPVGGRITFVWLFGGIGVFVLLLACINFINLSTARSQKRAREVGVRKVVGSDQRQLIWQFLSESFLVVMLAFVLSLVLLVIVQTPFNALADKAIVLPFGNPVFWTIAIAFMALTGFMAGLYPAFYLSSFQPVKALKGYGPTLRFRIDPLAFFPRQTLVVIQFTVSIVLIIGTLVVYQQIHYARNRPIGYERERLISLPMSDPNYKDKQPLLRSELLNTGVVSNMANSSNPLTAIWFSTGNCRWKGKDPNQKADFALCNVTQSYGKTVGWKLVAGRDFSPDFSTDSLESIIINESAVKYMGLIDPIGQTLTDVDEAGRIKWSRKIIGVVSNLVMESPYEPTKPTLYYFDYNAFSLLLIKINPTVSASVALAKLKSTLGKVVPTASFDYQFVDEEYGRKFSQEERIGNLSGVFSGLAIFICCLGLFGLASFFAEQRRKEIGVRKVLGASVIRIWLLLSQDFVILVVLSFLIAAPTAYYSMRGWLQTYTYHTEIPWWVFGIVGGSILLLTMLTVSFQSIKAAMVNPVKSLRSE